MFMLLLFMLTFFGRRRDGYIESRLIMRITAVDWKIGMVWSEY